MKANNHVKIRRKNAKHLNGFLAEMRDKCEKKRSMVVEIRVYPVFSRGSDWLGAIWKFPYVTGMSGGGAFFLIFVAIYIINWTSDA